jgi:hypothetical protein
MVHTQQRRDVGHRCIGVNVVGKCGEKHKCFICCLLKRCFAFYPVTKIQKKATGVIIFFLQEGKGRGMVGVKLVLYPYQIPTNSLPTPTTVGDDMAFVMLKSVVLTFVKKVWAIVR